MGDVVDVPELATAEKTGLAPLLEALVSEYQLAEGLEQYPWRLEEDRWFELVYCLLARIGQPQVPAVSARSAMLMLRTLNLLDVQVLASVALRNDEADERDENIRDIRAALQRLDFTAEQASIAATTLCDVARSLTSRFNGKVQRYLRSYGQRMIDELPSHFTLRSLPAQDARFAFTHWLQQVLNMPLPLSDASVEQLCERYHVRVDALVDAIDERDLNVALMDEAAINLVGASEP